MDLLCGGPPCQGFSGMNRFNSREYSQFKVFSFNAVLTLTTNVLEFLAEFPRCVIAELL